MALYNFSTLSNGQTIRFHPTSDVLNFDQASISAADWVPGGLDVDDGVQVAGALGARGCDAVRVLAGQTTMTDRPDFSRMYLVPLADRIRNEAAVPVLVGGGVTTFDQANTILAAGRADLCLMDLP